ncbi:uncharacterized protein L203_105286 [Cryptococcus depauperatus CBS 7841]|uniref:Uncharacterized protein n=1 Tax=Cryptococcus depauperatus CBS 7841 TaxID=1295531 RepID=A0A1E3HYN5_9TREE|nr:hypothetical protein L203_05657 [Cryptococcus depauperatus CBS 7841]
MDPSYSALPSVSTNTSQQAGPDIGCLITCFPIISQTETPPEGSEYPRMGCGSAVYPLKDESVSRDIALHSQRLRKAISRSARSNEVAGYYKSVVDNLKSQFGPGPSHPRIVGKIFKRCRTSATEIARRLAGSVSTNTNFKLTAMPPDEFNILTQNQGVNKSLFVVYNGEGYPASQGSLGSIGGSAHLLVNFPMNAGPAAAMVASDQTYPGFEVIQPPVGPMWLEGFGQGFDSNLPGAGGIADPPLAESFISTDWFPYMDPNLQLEQEGLYGGILLEQSAAEMPDGDQPYGTQPDSQDDSGVPEFQ